MNRVTGLVLCAVLGICVLAAGTAYAGHPCPVCNAEFSSRADLKEHIRQAHPTGATRRGGVRRKGGYVCPLCGKYFLSAARGIEHEKECSAPAPKKAEKPALPNRVGRRKPLRPGDATGIVPPGRRGVTDPAAAPLPGDVVVVLKNGSKFAGTLEHRSATSVTVKTPQGATLTFPMTKVKEIVKAKPGLR